jgi:hypothetical protein
MSDYTPPLPVFNSVNWPQIIGGAGQGVSAPTLFYNSGFENIFGPSSANLCSFDISSLATNSYIEMTTTMFVGANHRIILTVGTTPFCFPSSTTFFSNEFLTFVARIKKINVLSGTTQTQISVIGGGAGDSQPNPITPTVHLYGNSITTGGTNVSLDATVSCETKGLQQEKTVSCETEEQNNVAINIYGVSVFAFQP